MAGDVLNDVEYEDVTGSGLADEPVENDAKAEEKNELRPLSKRSPAAQFRILKTQCLADQDASSKWRRGATEDFGFVAGDQMSQEDKELLNAQQRPHIVFNRVQTILKAVRGMEINGRNDIAFIPRNTEDTESNEILSAGSDWMGQGCDAVDEESGAFEDAAITGMGWCEARFSYFEETEGKYIEENIDCREMIWDRRACKKNLVDARRMFRVRKMPLSDAIPMFPGKTKVQMNADWIDGIGHTADAKSIEDKRVRDGEGSYTDDEYDDANEVTIVCAQWWEPETFWLVANDATGERFELTDAEYLTFERRMREMGVPPLESVEMTRKVFKQAFLGSEYLKGGPAPAGNQFSWACITGEYDKKNRMFYGLVRVVRDPQMWANKFMSQVMYIMNSTAKGGILAETDAFDDERDAEDGYASSDKITWVTPGALSGGKPKIMPKPGQGDASSFVNLLQFAVSSIKDVTGINLELLGQQDQNQPGILEHMRKQAGMTTLATLFDSKKRFLQKIGRIRLHFLQTRMSDGRLIRVVGSQYDVKAVALAKENTTGTYDVVVDDAPTSPNQKEANWAIIQPMLGVFKDQLMQNPQVLVMVLQYSPLPAPLVNAISKVIMEGANNPQAAQQAEQMKQLAISKLTAEINKDQSVAELNNSKAKTSQATAAYDIAIAQNLMTKAQGAGQHEFINAQKMAAETAKMGTDAALTAARAERERVGTHLDVLKVHGEHAKIASDHEIGQQAAYTDHVAAQAKGHSDMAAAFRERVLAHLAARQPQQPMGGQ